MRKILAIAVTLLLAITLVACDKNKLYAKAEVTGLDNQGIGPNSVNIEVKVVDPDSQIGTDLEIYLLKDSKGDAIGKVNKSKSTLENNPKVSFTKLEETTNYQLKIDVAYMGKMENIYTGTFKTRPMEEFQIKEAVDFYKIKENPYATFELMNDIDFSDETQENINKNIIGTFRGVFIGNNHTINNYTIQTTNSSVGLFGQLSDNAEVSDLTINNMVITKEFPKDSKGEPTNKPTGTSSYIGLLAGQNSSSNVRVNNIIITNSKLDLSIDSTSNYLKFGLLAGTLAGKAENINVDNTNELNINLKKHTDVYIGGLVGELSNTAKLENIINGGTINVNIDQTNPDDNTKASLGGLSDKSVKVYIGGLTAVNKESNVANVITSTNINVDNINYSVEKNATDDAKKETKYIDLYIGGVFATYSSADTNDIVYNGNIKVNNSMTFTNNLTETIKDENDVETEEPVKLINKYEMRFYLGGIAGYTDRAQSSINNLVLSNSILDIALQSSEVQVIKVGTLFGYANNVNYNQTNSFGINGTVDVKYDNAVMADLALVRNITDLNAFYEGNTWIIDNL